MNITTGFRVDDKCKCFHSSNVKYHCKHSLLSSSLKETQYLNFNNVSNVVGINDKDHIDRVVVVRRQPVGSAPIDIPKK